MSCWIAGTALLLASCVIVPRPSALQRERNSYDASTAEEMPWDAMRGAPMVDDLQLYRLYQMCLAAWRQRDHFVQTGWRLRYVFEEETNTQLLILEEDDTLYLVFRGSDMGRSELDRRHNSMIVRRRPGFGDLPGNVRVHTGFLNKYRSIREQVLDVVSESKSSGIVTVGHSAGGALALLAFFDLLDLEPERTLYTVGFGAPRVVNRAGARLVGQSDLARRIVRVVNGADMVPRMPPAFLGYRHAGARVEISENAGLRLVSGYDHRSGYEPSLRHRAELAGAGEDFFVPYRR